MAAAPNHFLSAQPGGAGRLVLVGAPYDLTQSFRRGAAGGPVAVREASWSLEAYSPELDSDLAQVGLADLGDLHLQGLDPAAAVQAVCDTLARLDPSAVPVLLGGDHTVTVGAVRALVQRYSHLRVVVFDAHLDLREEYEGSPWSHACTVRRIWEQLGDGRVVVVGVRSGLREEWAFARSHCRWWSSALALPETVHAELACSPVYLSVDLDVLDPAYAPGVGNPEPGGPSFSDLLRALYLLRDLPVVGMDLVETAPALDPSGVTAVVAAKLLREMMLCFCRAPRVGPRTSP